MSCMPSVSQVEFSRQAKAPQPTWRALLRQRATSAVGTENGPSAGEPTVGSLGITAHSMSSLHKGCQGCSEKKCGGQKRIFILWWFTKDVQSLGANSDLTGDWTPYNSERLRHYLAQVHFSLGSGLYSTVWFFSAELGWTAPEIPKSFLKIVGVPVETHKHTLVPLAHTHSYTCTLPQDSAFIFFFYRSRNCQAESEDHFNVLDY